MLEAALSAGGGVVLGFPYGTGARDVGVIALSAGGRLVLVRALSIGGRLVLVIELSAGARGELGMTLSAAEGGAGGTARVLPRAFRAFGFVATGELLVPE